MKSQPWPLSEREVAEVMRTLRFDYCTWDMDAGAKRLILPASLVLTGQEHQRAVAVCQRFDDILGRLEAALLERPDVLQGLGIPEPVLPLVMAEQDTGLQLARYDLFLTPEGRWLVSEFNEDVPGGFNEAVGIPDLLGPSLCGATFQGDLRRAVTSALRPFEHVALLYATGYADDLQHVLLVRRWLEADGHTTDLASPAHLHCRWRSPRIFDHPCHAAFRFYPGEWFRWLPNRRHWRRALARLPMMNPLRRLIRQSKRLYALWHDPALLSKEDIAFLTDHTPRTLPFEQLAGASNPDVTSTGRSGWVLKHAFGRMGDAVVMGNLAGDREWGEALATARRSPREWVLQERFQVAAIGNNGTTLYPSLGVYLVNHAFAGYYSRAAVQPFINHEAYHVATTVESA